ncbi:hypothetical protein MKZ38_003661 [Zalerion maritima]|uniref:Uncharacterized protein n=1 Tax=Zalerion maritima TaxID=339359 RepID=A0AAD5RN71_9PEZI|nr:hypothetical protein MKZ38_003661 [Zalerion maritima]
MLSSISSMNTLARASHFRTLASRALAPTGAALLHGNQSQQVRTLWFNIFPSYLDPDSSMDKSRTQLRSRYRYMKSMSRQLSWEKISERQRDADKYYAEFLAKRRDMRGRGPWHMHCSRGGRKSSTESKSTDTKDSGTPWMPELHGIRRYLDEQRDAFASMIKPVDEKTTPPTHPGTEAEYVIDPITNRKIVKNPIARPVSQDERDQMSARVLPMFQHLFHSDGPPTPEELDEYRKVTIDTPTHNEELIHRVTDLPKKEPQGVAPEPPQPASEAPDPPAEYLDELEKYKKVDINYPPTMNEELIHRVEDLPKKEDPNGTSPEAPKSKSTTAKADGEPAYEDLDKYRPFMDREEALDPNAEDVKARSWPSRVRRLDQNIEADSTSKAAERKIKPSTPTNRFLNRKQDLSQIRARRQVPSLFELEERKPEPVIFHNDPYSKDPTGLELSWAWECANDPKADNMYIRHYSTDGTASDPVVVASSEEAKASTEPLQEARRESDHALDGAPAQECVSEPTPLESLKVDPEASRDMHNSCQDMYGSTGYTLEKEIRASQFTKEAQPETKAAEECASGSGEPTLYKILAYDPMMQKIEVAETTSEVQDASTPLSPAEVMLRLSNPSKFFPHFGPLQREGFEIVSGSGDVLVFRKVRSTVETPASGVNPIDMMGRGAVPNLGNFASPTGFVNYDYPIEEDDASSNANRASAEENSKRSSSNASSQSTESTSEQSPRPRKRGIAERTATGAAWLAGTAYGVGVVSEFVKRGGESAKATNKKV